MIRIGKDNDAFFSIRFLYKRPSLICYTIPMCFYCDGINTFFNGSRWSSPQPSIIFRQRSNCCDPGNCLVFILHHWLLSLLTAGTGIVAVCDLAREHIKYLSGLIRRSCCRACASMFSGVSAFSSSFCSSAFCCFRACCSFFVSYCSFFSEMILKTSRNTKRTMIAIVIPVIIFLRVLLLRMARLPLVFCCLARSSFSSFFSFSLHVFFAAAGRGLPPCR